MKFVKWLLVVALALIAALFVAVGIAWILTAPEPLPAGTESASRLEPGPFEVDRAELEWVHGSRKFPITLWFPEDSEGPHPLLVFSHGLMSSRYGCTYMAEQLASQGYVVVAGDHPLTNAAAPGGPDYLDVVHQPADVSFWIDQALSLEGEEKPFDGELDPERIGAFGISLGAATVTLATFHPEWRDARIAATISIAGPGDIFGPFFFDHASVPFLMIAGTSDAILDYTINALPIPERIRRGGLLTIEGGTHAGFTHVTAGLLRVIGNPDKLGCGAAGEGDIPQDQSVFVGLFGTREQGLITPAEYRPPCATTYDDAMRAGRQHMITTLAVSAFFESQFATMEDERREHARFLEHTLPAELSEVTYTPSRRSR